MNRRSFTQSVIASLGIGFLKPTFLFGSQEIDWSQWNAVDISWDKNLDTTKVLVNGIDFTKNDIICRKLHEVYETDRYLNKRKPKEGDILRGTWFKFGWDSYPSWYQIPQDVDEVPNGIQFNIHWDEGLMKNICFKYGDEVSGYWEVHDKQIDDKRNEGKCEHTGIEIRHRLLKRFRQSPEVA